MARSSRCCGLYVVKVWVGIASPHQLNSCQKLQAALINKQTNLRLMGSATLDFGKKKPSENINTAPYHSCTLPLQNSHAQKHQLQHKHLRYDLVQQHLWIASIESHSSHSLKICHHMHRKILCKVRNVGERAILDTIG